MAGYENSTIGDFNIYILQAFLSGMQAVIQATFSLIFSKGVRMEWIIKLLGMDIIDIKMSLLKPFDHYFIFFVTPIFNLNKLKSN